jgi:hypothetical protein
MFDGIVRACIKVGMIIGITSKQFPTKAKRDFYISGLPLEIQKQGVDFIHVLSTGDIDLVDVLFIAAGNPASRSIILQAERKGKPVMYEDQPSEEEMADYGRDVFGDALRAMPVVDLSHVKPLLPEGVSK